MKHRLLRGTLVLGCAFVGGSAFIGCASSGSGTALTRHGDAFYVSPEDAGFARPGNGAGDSLAWALHGQGVFDATPTAFADAPVD